MPPDSPATPDFNLELRADLIASGLQAESESAPIVQALSRYLDLLDRWNRTYNLTSIRDSDQMRIQHLGDCIAIVPALRQHADPTKSLRILDVGSGGGLPGVVLAVLHPQWQVDCVDAVGKKAAFVRQVAGELQLSRLRALHHRVEALDEVGAYDVIISRAFSDLVRFIKLSRHAKANEGLWVAMKGKQPHEELATLPGNIEVKAIHEIEVRGSIAPRCLIIMKACANKLND